MTPERCRARAEEAERLAEIVSYGRDKERLLAQAGDLRRTADAMEARQAPPAQPAAPRGPPLIARLLGRFTRRS
jgi:hypothetical protein